MVTLVLNRPFKGLYQPSNQGKNSSVRKQNRRDFDQPIPSVEKTPENRNFSYLLDSLSQIVSNQTLSPEQIAKSQLKLVDGKINSLTSKYEIYKIEEVRNFLSKNQILFSLLEEIPNKIGQYFSDSQKLSLKMSYEPDFPQSTELWVSILTELSAKEAMPILEKFDEEWWLENIDKADCKLNIILKFI